MTVHDLFSTVDYKLLKEQKVGLFKLIIGNKLNKVEKDHINGVLHVLDAFEDMGEELGYKKNEN